MKAHSHLSPFPPPPTPHMETRLTKSNSSMPGLPLLSHFCISFYYNTSPQLFFCVSNGKLKFAEKYKRRD